MKKYLFLFFLSFLASSCVYQVIPPYVYNTNPTYTWGYAEYFGKYYPNFPTSNVLSLSLFSDSLGINTIGNLAGTGQFLFLEDVFIPSSETTLPTGTYTINSSGLPNTVAPGKNDTIDNVIYVIGASISYYEGNTSMSIQKLITEGSFTVSRVFDRLGDVYSINCNFKTADRKTLKGTFNAVLPHIDQSLKLPATGARKKISFSRMQ